MHWKTQMLLKELLGSTLFLAFIICFIYFGLAF